MLFKYDVVPSLLILSYPDKFNTFVESFAAELVQMFKQELLLKVTSR